MRLAFSLAFSSLWLFSRCLQWYYFVWIMSVYPKQWHRLFRFYTPAALIPCCYIPPPPTPPPAVSWIPCKFRLWLKPGHPLHDWAHAVPYASVAFPEVPHMSLLMCHLLREKSPDVFTSKNTPPATIISYLNTVDFFHSTYQNLYLFIIYFTSVLIYFISPVYSGGETPCLPGTSLYL